MSLNSSASLPLSQPPKSICVLRLSAIGDVCHTLPVVRTLQQAWPNTQITWVIGKVEAMLIGDCEGIEFIVFDKKQGRAARQQLKNRLADRHFDVLLHMQASLRSSQVSRCIKADIKLGFDKARAKDSQWLFTNARIAAKPKQHVMQGLFGFAEALGVTEQQHRWDIPLSAEDLAFAKDQIADDGKALLISPCSSQRARNFRNWPVERYAVVADYAQAELGLPTIITGGPTDLERQYARDIQAACQVATPVDLVGKTTLKQLLALIARATAVLAPDSGPIHMASAVATPAIGLFASSNPLRTGPSIDQSWLVSEYPAAVAAEFGKSVDEVSWGKRVRDPEVMLRIEVEPVKERLAAAAKC